MHKCVSVFFYANRKSKVFYFFIALVKAIVPFKPPSTAVFGTITIVKFVFILMSQQIILENEIELH